MPPFSAPILCVLDSTRARMLLKVTCNSTHTRTPICTCVWLSECIMEVAGLPPQFTAVLPASLAGMCGPVTELLWWDHGNWDPAGDLSLTRNAENGCGQKWCIPPPRKLPMQLPTFSLPRHPDIAPEWAWKPCIKDSTLFPSPAPEWLLGAEPPPHVSAANWTLMWTWNKLFCQNTDISGLHCFGS